MSFSASVEKLIETSSSGLVRAAPWWRRIRLDHVAEILNGYPWRSSQFDDQQGVPVVRIRDVTSGATETFYRGKIEDGFWISDGDLLVGMDGDFNSRIWAGGNALLNQRVCRIATNEEFYLKELLAYVLPGYLRLINDETHSITVKHLSSKTLAELPLPLPSSAEQRRLVAKLDSLSAKSKRSRDHLNHIPRLVEKYKQAILAAAFRGELTLDWRIKNTSEPSASHFVEGRLRAFKKFCDGKGGRDERAGPGNLNRTISGISA
ncbi:MAG: restriction endonuclease subunit S [Xanthobacteraceae bacterium]|nr:restriction endonuclease subunit S [Xanthobacteraceae bacterium]